MDEELILVLTSYPDHEGAQLLAQRLIEQRLAACVNILPTMTSIYEWKGQLESGTEHLLMIKTRKKDYDVLSQEISQQHPYELPEIIAFPIEAGLDGYLKWIAGCTSKH